jgi:hypothetical protein
MALYINYKTEWHIGEPVPLNIGRVVTFQADGDELEVILDAMGARWSHVNDPLEVIAATLVFRDGRRIDLSQETLNSWQHEGPATEDKSLFLRSQSSLEPTVVYGELARPSND